MLTMLVGMCAIRSFCKNVFSRNQPTILYYQNIDLNFFMARFSDKHALYHCVENAFFKLTILASSIKLYIANK